MRGIIGMHHERQKYVVFERWARYTKEQSLLYQLNVDVARANHQYLRASFEHRDECSNGSPSSGYDFPSPQLGSPSPFSILPPKCQVEIVVVVEGETLQ